MKKITVAAVLLCVLLSAFSEEALPAGYGGIRLGMSMDEVKESLKKNQDFGYRGERDVSLLPGENRALIETDATTAAVYSYLERCWFQFYEDRLYIITINIDSGRMDHYSVFRALCEKYGDPDSISPEKSVWEDDSVTMSLERPLTLKYTDNATFEKLRKESLVLPSASEMTREMFLEGL